MRIFRISFRFPLLIATACSEQVIHETDGGMGDDGLNCWDVDGNGAADPAEDINGDGVVDAFDCQGQPGVDGSGPAGADGQNCWDTNGNGQMDPEEDVNGDGTVDVWDCWGQEDEDTGGGAQPTGEPYFSSVHFYSDEAMAAFCARYSVVYGGVAVTTDEEGGVTSFDGLSCLEFVSDYFQVTLNTGSWVTEVALPHLVEAGEISIYSAEPISLSMPVLETTGQLQLTNEIEAVELDSLTQVTGTLDLSQTLLSSLDAFANLHIVDGNLYMSDNDSMTDLTGMYGVSSISGEVRIYGNNLFTDSDAWDLINAIGPSNIGGNVDIYSNGSR